MSGTKSYFFCGIGGSGMLSLAAILRARGAEVAGSDRALDQHHATAKFDYLRSLGIPLSDQDGSGPRPGQIFVASAAVEEHVPDVVAACRLGLERITRAEMLARLFNAAGTGIAVGGTSGKSTVTGMIGWILHRAGRDPTVMNGAVMKNFATPDAPFVSALAGDSDLFVSEVDESDGSIAQYRPRIAVLNNVSHDHKTMDELRALFGDFLGCAGSAVVNADDPEARALAPHGAVTFGLADPAAGYRASDIVEAAYAVDFTATRRSSGETARVRLQVPGRHNVANALAALAATGEAGVPLAAAAETLGGYIGLRRRFDLVGSRNGVTVIDDFGHNPDKIAATLAACRAVPGRLLIFFQPHGYGPLRTMGDELIAAFARGMTADDILVLPEPAFFGGTVTQSVTSADIVEGVRAAGRNAEHIDGDFLKTRPTARRRLVELARPGDRILVMGARDDSLSQFAAEILESL